MAELRLLLEDDEWDLQIRSDAASGKLDVVDHSIESARREGALVPLGQIAGN